MIVYFVIITEMYDKNSCATERAKVRGCSPRVLVHNFNTDENAGLVTPTRESYNKSIGGVPF